MEAVPSLSVMEGPLEPPTSSAVTSVSEIADDSFVNFFSVCNFAFDVKGQPVQTALEFHVIYIFNVFVWPI